VLLTSLSCIIVFMIRTSCVIDIFELYYCFHDGDAWLFVDLLSSVH
jgi:hypothetical protein